MNVLLVTFEPSGKIVGGLGIFSEAIHKELNAVEGIEVKTLYLNPSLPSEEKCETVDYELFLGSEDEDFLKTEPYYNGLEKEYLTQLGDFQPDVIHLNDRQTCLPFLVNEKSVFSLHLPFALSLGYNPMNVSPEISEIFDLERSICQSGVPVIVYSDFMQREVHSKITINSSPMKLLLGIDQDKFYSGEKKKLICFVGRFSETHKGFLTFLRAISMINAFLEEKGYTVELYGRGNVDGIELPSSIVHSGFLDEAEKIKKLAETEIVVMPSRYEPFGYVGLEAISSGCTLITTKGMGQEEYANDSNALFIDQIHPVDLATKIVQAVVNPKAKNDHPECKSIFTIQEFVKMHVEIYQEVMNGEIAFRQYFSSYPTLTFREEASKHDINFHIDELLSTFSEWELERAIFVSPFPFSQAVSHVCPWDLYDQRDILCGKTLVLLYTIENLTDQQTLFDFLQYNQVKSVVIISRIIGNDYLMKENVEYREFFDFNPEEGEGVNIGITSSILQLDRKEMFSSWQIDLGI